MPLNANERELLERTREFANELNDWFAAQEITDPIAEQPGEDIHARGARLRAMHQREKDKSPSEIFRHGHDFQESYRERFRERALSIWDQFTALGIPPGETRFKYQAGTNSTIIEYILADVRSLIKQLETRE